MAASLIQAQRETIAEALAASLCKRRSSVFAKLGHEACLGLASAALDALVADLHAGQTETVRAFAPGLIESLTGLGATYSDLRSFCQRLRSKVRGVFDSESTDHSATRAACEAWFYELLLVISIRYLAWREQLIQQRNAQTNIDRLESQLDELEKALRERTELADMIRRASTPIVPIVKGILVVPLIGTFDAERAMLLTESLLNEVCRVRARVALIDISGVPVFDTAAAQMIISLARSVELLGGRIYLVGMSPDNARTIVRLGISITRFQTFGNLQDGLAHALRDQGQAITKIR